MIDINLNGTFYCNRAVAPLMVARTTAALSTSLPSPAKKATQCLGYSASKAGVIGLTKSLGKELAKHNITVNATPPLPCALIFDRCRKLTLTSCCQNSQGPLWPVDEMASLICWLASEEVPSPPAPSLMPPVAVRPTRAPYAAVDENVWPQTRSDAGDAR